MATKPSRGELRGYAYMDRVPGNLVVSCEGLFMELDPAFSGYCDRQAEAKKDKASTVSSSGNPEGTYYFKKGNLMRNTLNV